MDVKHDSLDAMWAFLQMGGQPEPDIAVMKEHCEMLRHILMQKTAGQRRDKPGDIPLQQLDVICNVIVIEAMGLYLSGELEKLEGG